jgi:hypothetical protein
MGTATGVLFVTTDLDTQHREWANRGVRFSHQPRQVAANVRVSTFLDPDDNAFLLSEVDSITTSLEAEHRALAERADRDHRAAHELEIATQVQAGLFPVSARSCERWTTPASAYRRGRSGRLF